jgi:maltose O-acetyltransferase
MTATLLRGLLADLAQIPRRVLINSIAAAFWVPWPVRSLLYRLAGLDVSLGARFDPHTIIRGDKVSVGAGTAVNYRCLFDARAPVTIGQRCGIGMGVQFITSTHDQANPCARAGAGRVLPITVEDGCWIAAGAMILPGVTVGEGCVVAAGAVVTQDCKPNMLYGGVPAKEIREL